MIFIIFKFNYMYIMECEKQSTYNKHFNTLPNILKLGAQLLE